VGRIFDMPFTFESQDAARSFFLELQNEIKNMNFLPFTSTIYAQAFEHIDNKLEAKDVGP